MPIVVPGTVPDIRGTRRVRADQGIMELDVVVSLSGDRRADKGSRVRVSNVGDMKYGISLKVCIESGCAMGIDMLWKDICIIRGI